MPSQQDMLEDAAAYAEKHKVFQLFESLLQEVVVHQPDKPIDHLIKVLKREPVPKVIVAGPPGAQVRALCEKLAAKTQLVHVVAGDLYRELARQNVPSALEAKALVDQGKGVPSATTLEMLKEKLLSADCLKYGWVLEGFPADPIEARLLAQGGLLPTRFLHINVADAEASRRLTGRVVDEQEALLAGTACAQADPMPCVADESPLGFADACFHHALTKHLRMTPRRGTRSASA